MSRLKLSEVARVTRRLPRTKLVPATSPLLVSGTVRVPDGEEDVTFVVEIDPDEVLRLLAVKALHNRRGRSHLGAGAVVVRVVSRREVRA